MFIAVVRHFHQSIAPFVPIESILAKRRGYGTLVSYNVPPYGRAGLYLELSTVKDLVEEYRAAQAQHETDRDLCQAIVDSAQRFGLLNDVPWPQMFSEVGTQPDSMALFDNDEFGEWILQLSEYLGVLQDRLFSSGLRYVGLGLNFC
jgi:magnesium chelatase subunit H